MRIRSGGEVVREVPLVTPGYTYSAADQSADGVSGIFTIEVAQVSALYGNGLWAVLSVAA